MSSKTYLQDRPQCPLPAEGLAFIRFDAALHFTETLWRISRAADLTTGHMAIQL